MTVLDIKIFLAKIKINFKETPILNSVSNEFIRILGDLILQKPEFSKKYITAPAARSHHQNYEAGLLEHSYKLALWLSMRAEAVGLTAYDCAAIAFAHDLCKVESYWFTNDQINFDQELIKRHASYSVEIAEKLGMELTEVQKVCIYLHMAGAWYLPEDKANVTPQQINKYFDAICATQWADMKACE